MPLELPEPDRRRLARSPLQLVVCQVRFEPVPRAAEPRIALAVHERFGGREGLFARVEPIQNLTFAAGAGAAPAVTATTGWRLTSAQRDWTLTLQTDQAALETTAYETWETYSERLFDLIEAVTENLEPATMLRLGLRYVDHITEPAVDTPAAWDRYLAREILGVVLHERLGPATTAAQQQVDFDAGDELRSTLRHGFFRDEEAGGQLTYVLDFDSYQEGFREWNEEAIKSTATNLNDLVLRIFQQVVTTDLLTYMREEELDAGDA